MKKTTSGFTIVELLIVIVVVAILAAISIVAYNGIQQRARDSQRQQDLAQIVKAIKLYAVDNDSYLNATDGCSGGVGWLHNDYDGAGPQKSMLQCLIDGGYLSSSINDPQSSKGCVTVVASPLEEECFYYMKYDCGEQTYLYANLESIPHSLTDTNSTCQQALDSRYGMNHVVRVN